MSVEGERLDAVIARALGEHDDPTWDDLVVATVQMARAVAAFDAARNAYVARHPYQREQVSRGEQDRRRAQDERGADGGVRHGDPPSV